MDSSYHQFDYPGNSQRYHFHQPTQAINLQYFGEFFDSNSLKTVFYKIPGAIYIQFVIYIIMKKPFCSIVSTQLMKFFTSKLIHFSKESNIGKAIASFHTELHSSKSNLLRRKDIIEIV